MLFTGTFKAVLEECYSKLLQTITSITKYNKENLLILFINY